MKTPSQHGTIPPLVNGDKLNRYEFEHRYNAMPDLKKAELIEGIVYVDVPQGLKSHSEPYGWIMGWLETYAALTPGVRLGIEPTVGLDLDN